MAKNSESKELKGGKMKEKNKVGNSWGKIGLRKFKLLLWKNFKVQSRNKLQTLVEIFIPIVFILALVYLRMVVPVEKIKDPTMFEPFELRKVPRVMKTATNQIFYTPNSTYWDEIMRSVKKDFFTSRKLNYSFVAFPTESEMVKAYENSMKNAYLSAGFNITSPVLAGIVFRAAAAGKEGANSSIHYKLRFPAYQRTEFDIFSERLSVKPSWYTDTLYPIFVLPGPRSRKSSGGFPGYFEEGFLYLQNAVDSSFIKSSLNTSQREELAQYNLQLQRFPYPEYSKDGFTFALQLWFAYFLSMSFVYPTMNITKMIVHEKERRLKEILKIMGLHNWLHWTAWFVKAFVLTGLSMALDTILLKIRFSGGKAILTEGNGLIIFAVLLCHSVNMIGFSFFMSTLFSTANVAATSTGFAWMLCYVPFSFAFSRINMMTRQSKYLSCLLLGNVPLAHACYIMAMFEGSGAGVQWGNIMEGVSPNDSFSIFDCMIMMLVNGVAFMIVGFYIELIWPGKYGVPLPWYFPFTKWYWTDRTQEKYREYVGNERSDKSTAFFEAEPNHLNIGINIRGLTKIFGKNTAVNNLNLNFYQNQVTALLGHNGAGKTTTMSMLTGLVTPTSGTAIVNGFDICKDMRAVRGSLGLCPQYNVLFDDLTVEEHFLFFSLLKGYNANEAETEVKRMIQALGFEAKSKALAHTLSGGMKRKLSIGIAFCAGSKVVLLDEPTAGMDPSARRSTWDLIQQEKLGRTVILSTHFMEEADLLGDRIAIMTEGRLKCCGRSLFLKKQYGGYHCLIVVKDLCCVPNKVRQFLEQRIPSIRLKNDMGAELTFTLPDESSSLFPSLFEDLEEEKASLGITSFGITNTSMEEVFMRAGQSEEKNQVESKDKKENGFSGFEMEPLRLQESEKLMLFKRLETSSPQKTGLVLLYQQFKAMLQKKMWYILRNRDLALLQIAIPVLFIAFTMSAMKNAPGISTPPPLQITLDNYEILGRTTTLTKCTENQTICEGYRSFLAEKYNVENVDAESLQTFYLQKASANLRASESKYMIGLETTPNNSTSGKPVDLIGFFNNQPFHNPPLALNAISNGILRSFGILKEISLENHPFDYNDADSLKQTGNVYTLGFMAGWIIQVALGIMGAAFSIFLVYERMSGAKHLQFVAGLKAPIYWAVEVITDIVNFMIPCVIILLVLILLDFKQFKDVDVMSGYLNLCFAHGWSMAAMTGLFSFAFTIPSTGFARVMLLNIGTGMISMLLVSMLETPEYNLEHLVAMLHNIFIVIIPGYALGMGIVQISSHCDLKESCVNFNLEVFCKLDASFVCCSRQQESYYSWEPLGIGKNLFALFCFGVLCFLGIFIIESRVSTQILAKFQQRKSTEEKDMDALVGKETDVSDEDVTLEVERICTRSLNKLCKTDNLLLRSLTKTFGRKLTAVDNLSLGIGKGETFGLLGVNGAGKTTTFQMLTGNTAITSGDAYLCGHSVRRDLPEVYRNLGYCPQFDALIEQLTGRETIRIFANLKGIEGKYIDQVVNNLAGNLLFSEHIDKQVGEYSGGNKRKLSTALAMLGNPPVIFFDEPTNGMDPVARRHVWDALIRLRELGTSVVITSHSMEECDALCSRLAIMVNGRFQCLGSPQHLKNKFGEGYSIIVQLSYPEAVIAALDDKNLTVLKEWGEELLRFKNYIKTEFSFCELKDSHQGFLEYHVPGRGERWAKLFAVMEQAKAEFNLEAYSIGQTSLEQVFFRFTKLQNSFED